MIKKIYQTIFLSGVMGLALTGCSIVVFEDGPDCPEVAGCPVTNIPSIEHPEKAPITDVTAEPPVIVEPETSLPTTQTVAAPPLIDGYVTNFAYDSAELKLDTTDHLAIIAEFLADKPAITLVVEGHCDERGSRDYNLALGDRRAAAVRDVLVANGMGSDRIRTVSYGKERPLAVGSTPEIWAQNRRALIRTLND